MSRKASVHGHGIPRQRVHEFRLMAKHAEDPQVAAAVEAGASRAEVLRKARRADLLAGIAAAQADIDAERDQTGPKAGPVTSILGGRKKSNGS